MAFNAHYLQADTWNSSRTYGFFGAVLSAFVAGASAGRLAQNVYQKAAGNDRPPNRWTRQPGRISDPATGSSWGGRRTAIGGREGGGASCT